MAMKYLPFLLLIFIIPFKSLAQIHFEIIGKIENTYSALTGIKNEDSISIEFSLLKKKFSGVVKNSAFHIEGDISEPCHGMLEFKGGGIKLLVDGNRYDLKIAQKDLGNERYSYDFSIKTNSSFHNLWSDFYDHQNELFKQRNSIEKKIESALNGEMIDKYTAEKNAVNFKIIQGYKDLAKLNPDNAAVAYILPDAPDFSYKDYFGIYQSLSTRVKGSLYGKMLLNKLSLIKGIDNKEIVSAETVINQPFPLITTVDTAGNKMSFEANLFAKQKFTLIEIWASWCVPCRAVNKNLVVKLKARAANQLKVIGYSLDGVVSGWKKAIKEDNANWMQVSDLKAINSPLVKYLNLTAIPANVIVDQSGKIVARDVYGDDLDSYLK